MLFGPNRPMSPMQQPSLFRNNPSPFMQQAPKNLFNMFNMRNPSMSNMQNPMMMMRNQSPFMGGMGNVGGGMNPGGIMNAGGGSRGGGLLARLLGRTGARSIGNMGGLGQLASGGGGLGQLANTGGGLGQLANAGTLQQLVNPNNLTGMLGNVQKALKMAEGVMPMVQQYGPLVRNVPAMLKLYSELKNVDDAEEESEKEEEVKDSKEDASEEASTEKKVPKKKKKRVTKKPESTEAAEDKPKGTPAPKLYI
ncbi:YqfQ family protein [Sutcliffiella rhizosphaerae]|uniref:YqfQ-like protein n=1 Tax=Sutcliffiella rhizosphaerae TaxID=2880967 RepID=A0ABN8A2K9_9BACI|nr:YqfQ family protein [Sutcliffiella rhizosphaerae]CAG9619335.1 hypothetical protein BACCIP111883_00102 [Sutcliffiella rhizosphaerae]